MLSNIRFETFIKTMGCTPCKGRCRMFRTKSKRKLAISLLALGILFLLINETSAQISLPQTTTTTPSPVNNGICSIPALSPCVPAATCRPSEPIVGEAICMCPTGYAGDGRREEVGGIGCYDIDECLSGTDICDRLSEVCVNTNGGYQCNCASGFKRDATQINCIDVDECLTNLNLCNTTVSRCFNTPGAYDCVCLDPKTIFDFGLGTCRNINLCTDWGGSMNPCSQACTMSGEDAVCSCFPGYQLSADNLTCVDIDECVTGNNSCDKNGIISYCVNTIGAYRCECNNDMGYTNLPDGLGCTNLDECSTDATACGTGAMCCLDLPPPQRFLCLIPGAESSNTAYIQSNGGTNPQMFEVLSRSHVNEQSVEFNPSFNSLSNGVNLNSYSSDIPPSVSMDPSYVDKLFPTSQYSPITEQIYPSTQYYGVDIGDGSVERASPRISRTSEIILQNQCFKYYTVYKDNDIAEPIFNVSYASTCQNLCASISGCNFYSFNTINNTCHLKATSFTPYADPDYVSGASLCSYQKKIDAISQQGGMLNMGLTSIEAMPLAPGLSNLGIGNTLFGRFLSDLNECKLAESNEHYGSCKLSQAYDTNGHGINRKSFIRKDLSEQKNNNFTFLMTIDPLKIYEGIIPSELCGGMPDFHSHCLVAGSLRKSEIESLLSDSKKPIGFTFRTLDGDLLHINRLKSDTSNIFSSKVSSDLSPDLLSSSGDVEIHGMFNDKKKYAKKDRFLAPLLSRLGAGLTKIGEEGINFPTIITPLLRFENTEASGDASTQMPLLSSLSNNFKYSSAPSHTSAYSSPSSSNSIFRTPQLFSDLAFTLNDVLGENGNLPLNIYTNNIGALDSVLPNSFLNPACPRGYVYSPDVVRQHRMDLAMNLAREFLVTEENGTVTAKDPSKITNSLVTNTGFIADELAKWYIEMASAPVQLASAAFGNGDPQPAYRPDPSIVLTQQTLPGGVTPSTGTNIDRKKMNSAMLSTIALFSALAGRVPSGMLI